MKKQTYEGPLDFEGVSKERQLEVIEPWTLSNPGFVR